MKASSGVRAKTLKDDRQFVHTSISYECVMTCNKRRFAIVAVAKCPHASSSRINNNKKQQQQQQQCVNRKSCEKSTQRI